MAIVLPDGVLSNPDTEYVRLTLEVFMVTAIFHIIKMAWPKRTAVR